MTATARSVQLGSIAQQVADALPTTARTSSPALRSRTPQPERLAERIDEALSEPDPQRAPVVMTELQADTVAIAPDGPNVVRARQWLGDAREILIRRIGSR